MKTYTAFSEDNWLATGTRADIVSVLRTLPDVERSSDILVFDDENGSQIDFDLRDPGNPDVPAKRGRPKLGVISKEVTLLPRHWEWLSRQSGGASATLRKLVEQARKSGTDSRAGQDAAYHFLSVMAGNWRHYEEAIRALYAGDADRFGVLTEKWPVSVRDHARGLAWPE